MEVFHKKTKNGRIFKCSKCNDIHIEFKIININLSVAKFKVFSRNVIAIDGKEWEQINADMDSSRKIILPLDTNRTILLQLNNEELEELKELVEQIWVKENAI